MLYLFHFDWFGPAEELDEIDEAWKKACAETDGIKFEGRYAPSYMKYHWTWVFDCISMSEFYEARDRVVALLDWKRDYNKMPHQERQNLSGPFNE